MWIEMIDHVQRARQLAYVVRVTQRGVRGPFESFMRIRTGRELAHVISICQFIAAKVEDGRPVRCVQKNMT